MSWIIPWQTVASPSELGAKIDAFLEGPGSSFTSADEVREQLAASVLVAAGLMSEGALGRGPWQVQLSGHANPGHAPRAGWAPDSVQVYVRQYREEAAPPRPRRGGRRRSLDDY